MDVDTYPWPALRYVFGTFFFPFYCVSHSLQVDLLGPGFLVSLLVLVSDYMGVSEHPLEVFKALPEEAAAACTGHSASLSSLPDDLFRKVLAIGDHLVCLLPSSFHKQPG